MKIQCRCGETIFDAGDALPNKAHVIPDEAWLGLIESIDATIEKTPPGARAREAACMSIRRRLSDASRQAWQCMACGRLYMDDSRGALCEFSPAANQDSRGLFTQLD